MLVQKSHPLLNVRINKKLVPSYKLILNNTFTYFLQIAKYLKQIKIIKIWTKNRGEEAILHGVKESWGHRSIRALGGKKTLAIEIECTSSLTQVL